MPPSSTSTPRGVDSYWVILTMGFLHKDDLGVGAEVLSRQNHLLTSQDRTAVHVLFIHHGQLMGGTLGCEMEERTWHYDMMLHTVVLTGHVGVVGRELAAGLQDSRRSMVLLWLDITHCGRSVWYLLWTQGNCWQISINDACTDSFQNHTSSLCISNIRFV